MGRRDSSNCTINIDVDSVVSTTHWHWRAAHTATSMAMGTRRDRAAIGSPTPLGEDARVITPTLLQAPASDSPKPGRRARHNAVATPPPSNRLL